MVKTERDDLHLLAGSYALDALSEFDHAAFERHLQHCGACDAEVRGFRETAARLGLARAVDPPSALREQVLAAAHRTRQLPPLTGEGLHRSPRRRPGRVPRLLVGAVAACAAAGIAFGVVNQVGSTPKPATAISSVLGAGDARTMTVQTAVGGTLTAVVSWDKDEAVVTTAGLAALPAHQVYQLWVMGPAGTTQARSAGLVARASSSGPVLAAALRPGDRIGVTVEPAGGTAQPTTPPVAVMTLPA
jgi:anti-sigma-K factor RskA